MISSAVRTMSLVATIVLGAVAVYGPARAEGGLSIEESFRTLTKSTRWVAVEEIKIEFRTYHPQGMTFVDERIFLSSVEVINRGKGLGKAHLFEISREGELLRSLSVGEGAIYHPGGIDYDGTSIWVPVAEYSPNSRSIVYTIDPDTLRAREVFRFNDHLGAIAHNAERRELVGMSWGSRRIYRWATESSAEGPRPVDAANPEIIDNVNHYIDYQDMQMLAKSGTILCAGLYRYRVPGRDGGVFGVGGIDLLDLKTLRPVHQLPITNWVTRRMVMTQNPFYVERIESRLRFYFAPEDDETVIYVFETRATPDSRETP